MKKYEVISIDLFQTLVNIDTRIEHIWKQILKSDFSWDLMKTFVNHVNNTVVNKFHAEQSQNNNFFTLRELFQESFTEVFQKENVDYSPSEAAEIFINEHNNADIYHDSIDFISRAKTKYKICLASDADHCMVVNHLDSMDFDAIFISEQVKAYKGNPEGILFKSILNHYNVEPEKVLHIGDSSSDIIGASNMRINTCWINRHEYEKRFQNEPTYSISSLKELYPILSL